MSNDLYEIETPLLDAIDLCRALNLMFSTLDDSDAYHRAALRAVVNKALDSLQEVKDIWRSALRSQAQKPKHESSATLSVVEGDKSA
jgi:rhamnogalacturonyl hydrolase YesR